MKYSNRIRRRLPLAAVASALIMLGVGGAAQASVYSAPSYSAHPVQASWYGHDRNDHDRDHDARHRDNGYSHNNSRNDHRSWHNNDYRHGYGRSYRQGYGNSDHNGQRYNANGRSDHRSHDTHDSHDSHHGFFSH